eukprot:gene25560-11209_t
MRNTVLRLTEAVYSKGNEITEQKKLNEKLKKEHTEQENEYKAHFEHQGQVIQQQQEEIMLLEARLNPSMTTSQESKTESVVEKLKEKTAVHQASCQTEGCTSLGVQEIACQTDTNPTTTLIKHETGSQTHTDTIIRSAVTPERQEMSCQTDVEHVSESRTQIVASKSACLVKKTSQAPLVLAVQSSPADAVNELASAKIDLGIQKRMHLVTVQRLNEAEEQNAKLKFANREQTALRHRSTGPQSAILLTPIRSYQLIANKYCRDGRISYPKDLQDVRLIPSDLGDTSPFIGRFLPACCPISVCSKKRIGTAKQAVGHVSAATTQIVASKSACLVKKTSQAPLVLAAVQC